MREQAKTPESSFQRAYLRQKKREREQVRVFRALLLVSFLVLWEVAADLRWIDPFIFSSPVRVGKTFVTLLTEQNLLRHIGITVYETGISFLLVSALGMAFAVLLWLFPRFSAVMEPYLVVLNSLPKSALAPLLIVWMGANVKTIITAGISVAIFGSVISIYSSFQSVEPDMLRLIATLGGTKKDMLFRVVLPWSFPGLLAVWKVNIGLCLVGVVIGEFIGAREGLGYLIIYGSQVFRYAHAREGRMTDDWNRMSGRTKRKAVRRTTRFAGQRGYGKNLRTVCGENALYESGFGIDVRGAEGEWEGNTSGGGRFSGAGRRRRILLCGEYGTAGCGSEDRENHRFLVEPALSV